jgi:RNA polymerase sigma-70 factor (ECF subfamily)
MALDPDAALMLAFRGGDESAFRAIFEKHGRAMVAFCNRFVKDPSRAEELAQDVFLKVYRSAGGYEPTARFTTFLYRIATNHCLNEVRRASHDPRPENDPRAEDGGPLDPDALPSAGASPEDEATGRALARSLERLLARLPENQRAAFVLCRFQGLPYEDIAQVLGVTVPAVKSLVHRATVAAAEALAPFAGGEGAAA